VRRPGRGSLPAAGWPHKGGRKKERASEPAGQRAVRELSGSLDKRSGDLLLPSINKTARGQFGQAGRGEKYPQLMRLPEEDSFARPQGKETGSAIRPTKERPFASRGSNRRPSRRGEDRGRTPTGNKVVAFCSLWGKDHGRHA